MFHPSGSLSHLPPGDLPVSRRAILADAARCPAAARADTVAVLVTAAVEQERARVARELHDELAQSLFAMRIDCGLLRQLFANDPERAVQRLDALQRELDVSAASVRRIASGLRPATLASIGFAGAVEWLAREFRERSGARCQVSLRGDMDVQEPYAANVFRILQEALANVRKHAGARDTMVSVARDGDLLSFCVRDDGCGFAPVARRRGDAMGILGLEERARLIDAELVVSSAPGQGTAVAGCVRIVPPRPVRSPAGAWHAIHTQCTNGGERWDSLGN